MEEINDKELERLLDMQEHPENYSDEELEAMLDNDDLRLLSDMKRALAYERSKEEKIFSTFTLHSSIKKNSSLFTLHSSLTKVAAMFIGAILLAGVTFAAIRLMKERTPMPIDNDIATEIATAKTASESTAVEKTDSIVDETIVQFDDAELGDILSAMATHYSLKLVYDNEAAKSIKLFLKWNKEEDIDKTLEILNAYDRINIEHRGDELIVK